MVVLFAHFVHFGFSFAASSVERACCCCCLLQGPKPAERLAKGEPEGSEYDYESKIDFAVFPSLQVRLLLPLCALCALNDLWAGHWWKAAHVARSYCKVKDHQAASATLRNGCGLYITACLIVCFCS
jgi:hypothetical protein